MDAQRPFALDALDVDVVETVEHPDVAGLPDLIDQFLHHRFDRRPTIVRAEGRQREAGQARADQEALTRGITQQQPAALQLPQQTMNGLARQPEPRCQIGQANPMRVIGHGLEHSEGLAQHTQPLVVFCRPLHAVFALPLVVAARARTDQAKHSGHFVQAANGTQQKWRMRRLVDRRPFAPRYSTVNVGSLKTDEVVDARSRSSRAQPGRARQ